MSINKVQGEYFKFSGFNLKSACIQCCMHFWCTQPPRSSSTIAMSRELCFYRMKFGKEAPQVQQAGVQVGTSHIILCFYLFYHSLGKWACQLLKVSVVGPGEKNPLTVWDRRSGPSFLIDFGADKSVCPA